VIALASSAGGLAALRRVLADLPASLPASVVALQHAQPDRPTMLADLLRGGCALPVVAAVDGAPLRPGTVVVAPAGWHTLITAEPALALIRSGGFPPSRPSADLLFTSLALAVGDRAIAVILSGLGHDGATGASAIVRFGGRLIASDRASSEQFSMPSAAIDREDIHHVLPLDQIGRLLTALVTDR
jgi:two-component system chemotaxis response regulator CheB